MNDTREANLKDNPATGPAALPVSNFIRNIIEEDNRTGKWNGRVETRFPPEPNGYLHIGHAKSICLNFGLARDYNGICHLRFDDTNPEKEEQEYVDSILDSVKWLGFSWDRHLHYASDYFDKLYEFAEYLIKRGKAYVDSLTAEEIRALRGTLTEAGENSPYRERPIEENLDLFRRMKAGEFADGDACFARQNRHDISRTSTCAILSYTVSVMFIIIAQAINGASTRCTITRIAFPMRWKKLPTRFARWNSKITVRSMIGCWINWRISSPAIRSKSNLRG